MLRPTLSRRAATSGIAAAAVASLALTGAASAAPAAPRLHSSDATLAVQKISVPLAGTNGTLAFIQVTNTSPSLTLDLSGDDPFVVDAYNSANAVIASASPQTGNLQLVGDNLAPGQTGVVDALFTVGGIDHFGVVTAGAQVSRDPADAFSLAGAPTVTPSTYSSSDELKGAVTNPTPYTQTAKVVYLAEDATGRIIGESETFVDNIPAGQSGTFDDFYTPAAGQPKAASYAYFPEGEIDTFAGSTDMPPSVPVKGDAYIGATVTVEPSLYSGGKPLSGKKVTAYFRIPGQAPTAAGSATTNSSGTADIKVTIPGIRSVFFAFAGDATNAGSSTGDLQYEVPASLTLNKFSHKVHGRTVAITAKPKARTAFTGTFAHPDGEKVDLQEFINRHWRTVAKSGAIHGSGAVTIHLKAPSKKGKYQFRFHLAGNDLHIETTSGAQTLTVS